MPAIPATVGRYQLLTLNATTVVGVTGLGNATEVLITVPAGGGDVLISDNQTLVDGDAAPVAAYGRVLAGSSAVHVLATGDTKLALWSSAGAVVPHLRAL